MLLRFVQSIAESRDFCCFWEIDRHYRPAPVDYTSDSDFWYTLPANFDLLDACYRMYLLTGDSDYIQSDDFTHFYDLSMTKYIQRWDSNGDGIPEAMPDGGRRGIPSYEESEGADAVQMLDLLSAQQRAFRSYAEMKKLAGDIETASKYLAYADAITAEIDREWWDASKNDFFFVKCADGSRTHITKRPSEYVLYFGAVSDKNKRAVLLDALDKRGRDGMYVEVLSHMSEIFYNYGDNERGLYWLKQIINPSLYRREYPEVSFAAAGDYIFGLMGVSYDLGSKSISANPHLPESIEYAAVRNLPVYGSEADIIFEKGKTEIIIH